MTTYEEALSALSEPTRRVIYERVRERPRSVGELAADLPVSRPAVSQHLRVLEEARLVGHRRQGTRHIYHPDPAGLAPLRAYVETLWDDVLQAYRTTGCGESKGDADEE